ncbi:FAS1-like dehydratase domain-containing protein [Nakamurella lactea]|uniref:FAS1-like dehydratase domain-containing protein n=1 Tax=Nakamurella lactea TaxID=459515 RepID=UPI00041E7719|nr:MaoC family dehydratase N-terminal domain-containing protein [Nakamurella lactea]
MKQQVDHGRITDEGIEKMRLLIGYPNPTIRSGRVTLPWNTEATVDAIRHFAEGYGDDNPMFVDPEHGVGTRWGSMVAPPGFEATMGMDRSPKVPADLRRETRGALRGVQLYHSGNEARYYRPITPGTTLDRTYAITEVTPKSSTFAGRSVIVTNNYQWFSGGQLYVDLDKWFVHAERKPKKPRDPAGSAEAANGTTRTGGADSSGEWEPYVYTVAEIEEIDELYRSEFVRGADTRYWEDVTENMRMPVMAKGPLTVTDMFNFHMGAGWLVYGNPALKLAAAQRQAMPGFYSRNRNNAWDVMQRVHWEEDLAREVGVPTIYDIGPMRWSWLLHYCTNWCGDDGWVYRARCEFRKFNFVGDTTRLQGRVIEQLIHPELGPSVELEITGTNQRGEENIRGSATVLLPSRERGPVVLPSPPPPGRQVDPEGPR